MDVVEKGELYESFIVHPCWEVFVGDIEKLMDSIVRSGTGQIIKSLETVNYENGRWRGLKEALTIVSKAIESKNRVVSAEKAEDTPGGYNVR